MKYHINFGEDKSLSFEVLDNPVAKAWAENLKTVLAGSNVEQSIYQQAFAGIHGQHISHFNEVTYFYNKVQESGIIEDLFELNPNIVKYSDKDFISLSTNVNELFLKVTKHDIYYMLDKKTNFILKDQVTKIKIATEQMLDCVYNTDESYARIQVQSTKYAETPISIEMRKEYWVESARPKVVIRAVPNFDLRSLEVVAQRNHPHLFVEGVNDHAHYINVDHKICFYDQSLTTKQADQLMKEKRNKILDFVSKNKINVNPGSLQHNNFVTPIVAYLISDEETLEEYFNLFNKDDKKVTITLEE